MRVNSNKKIHKMKRDPYKTLLRTAGILAIVVVVGVGVFICALWRSQAITFPPATALKRNAEAELEFNAMMNELRAEQSAALAPNTGVVSSADLPSWEKIAERYPLAHRG